MTGTFDGLSVLGYLTMIGMIAVWYWGAKRGLWR